MPKKELRNELDHTQFEFRGKRGDVIQTITSLEGKLQAVGFVTGDEYLATELREALEIVNIGFIQMLSACNRLIKKRCRRNVSCCSNDYYIHVLWI